MNTRFAAAVALCCAQSAFAQVTTYNFSKAASYEQTADDTPPVKAYTWAAYAELTTTDIADATYAEVSFNGFVSPLVLEPIGKGLPIFRAFGGYFPTQEVLDLHYEPGIFTFTVDGGTLGNQSDTLELPADMYPVEIPYVTGTTFSRLHGMNTGIQFDGTCAPFTPPAGVTFAYLTVAITDGAGLGPSFVATLDPSATTFTVPAGTLAGGTEYTFALAYTAFVSDPGHFPEGLATSSYAFTRGVGFAFVTACDADFDGDGFITGLDFDLFVAAFEAGEEAADFDGDGFITGIDFDSFVLAYEIGCN